MNSEARQRRRGRIVLAVLGVSALALAAVGVRARVDVENAALKAPGTREAVAALERSELFGDRRVVLAAFDSAGKASELAALLAPLRARLEASDDVAAVRELPHASARGAAWAIEVSAGDRPWAPAVESIAATLRDGVPSSVRLALSGQPLGEIVLAREVQRESRRMLPLIVGAMVALLLVVYRRVGLALAILAPPAIAIAWTSGVRVLLGRDIDPVAALLEPVLLTVGVAAGVHWIEHFLELRRAGSPVRDAARACVGELRKPALFAALTTVTGFLALTTSAIPAVIDFGVFAALGVALTYFFAALAMPALLETFAAGEPPSLRAPARWPRSSARWLAAHASSVRAAAVVVALFSVAAWPALRADNDPLRVLPETHAFRRDAEELTRALGGGDTFALLVPAESSIADASGVGLLASAVAAEPGVARIAGPASRASNGSWLVEFLLAPGGSSQREALFARVEQRAAALGAPNVRVTGSAVQVARDSGRLIRSVVRGSLASVAVLFALFWLAFRSVAFACLALIPNVLPCLVVYGALALADRSLSFATAMISSVMLGLIVDDTLHLLHRFRELRTRGWDALASVERTIATSGRSAVITSIVLALGFAVGLAGRLNTTVEFCGFAAATIVIAFACDAILLPALLVPARATAHATHRA